MPTGTLDVAATTIVVVGVGIGAYGTTDLLALRAGEATTTVGADLSARTLGATSSTVVVVGVGVHTRTRTIFGALGTGTFS